MGVGERRRMIGLVLETDAFASDRSSAYDDTTRQYEFPSRYLPQFDALLEGEAVVAVLYEPRGDAGTGRMSFIGWGLIDEAPHRAGTDDGSGRWTVTYARGPHLFDRPVPREVGGEPVEGWLAKLARGRPRNVAVVGRAVRPVEPEDLQLILSLGVPDRAPEIDTRDRGATSRDRLRHSIDVLQRDSAFRTSVLAAYDHRCAVSGFGDPKRQGLVDAAHIRPAGTPHEGPDDVTNGIALSPTLHRMFDRGLISLDYVG